MKKENKKNVLRPQKGKSIVIDVDDYVVLDIETTGKNPQKNRIEKISALRIEKNKIVSSFFAENIYTNKSNTNEVFQSFYKFISEKTLVGFNFIGEFSSSSNFLYDAFKNEINKILANDMVEIKRLANLYVGDKKYTLPSLCFDLGLAYKAKNVCYIINQIYILLREKIPEEFEFGCCSQYFECSNKKICVHSDRHMRKGCHYKKNLDAGKIFFGGNKNID